MNDPTYSVGISDEKKKGLLLAIISVLCNPNNLFAVPFHSVKLFVHVLSGPLTSLYPVF